MRKLLLCSLLIAACSDDPAPPDGPLGPLTYNELIEACVRTAACKIKTQPRLSNCVDYYRTTLQELGLRGIYDRIYRCVNEARGACAAIYACFGANIYAGSCDQSFKASCDGVQALTCDLLDGRVYILNCAHASLSCNVKSVSTWEASCSKGSCVVGGYQRRCDGDRVLTCYQGVIVVDDCPARGLECKVLDPGGARCVGKEQQSCDEQQYKASCSGNVALTCVGDQVHKTDCAKQMINRRCASGQCVPAGSQCLDQFNRCAGVKLEACLDGRWQAVDCEALGLGPCEAQVNGASCKGQGV